MKVTTKKISQMIKDIIDINELNAVIDTVKFQQKFLRGLQTASARGAFRIGDTVSASGRNGSIEGEITQIKRTTAIVNVNGTRYDVPMSMLKMVRSIA